MLKGKRILVIEDQALLALLIEDVLTAENADVVVAATLAAALDVASSMLQERGLDAAVADLDLAGQSAMPVIGLLRSHGVPVVIQTGYADIQSDGPILRKPYAMDDLVATVVDVTRTMRLAA